MILVISFVLNEEVGLEMASVLAAPGEEGINASKGLEVDVICANPVCILLLQNITVTTRRIIPLEEFTKKTPSLFLDSCIIEGHSLVINFEKRSVGNYI